MDQEVKRSGKSAIWGEKLHSHTLVHAQCGLSPFVHPSNLLFFHPECLIAKKVEENINSGTMGKEKENEIIRSFFIFGNDPHISEVLCKIAKQAKKLILVSSGFIRSDGREVKWKILNETHLIY